MGELARCRDGVNAMEIHRHMHHYQGANCWGAIIAVRAAGQYRLGEVITDCTDRDEAALAIDTALQAYLDGETGDEFIAWSGTQETLQ